MADERLLVQQLERRVEDLEGRLAVLEKAKRFVPLGGWQSLDWSYYPPLLSVAHLAEIYGRSVGAIRKGLQQRSAKLPTPCQSRPFKVRRADCKRHFDRMST